MKTPSLKFDIKEVVQKFCKDKLARHESEIMIYVLKQKGFFETFDAKNCTITYEKVKNYSIGIHTRRYNGELLFRRFSTGLKGLEYSYEIEEN